MRMVKTGKKLPGTTFLFLILKNKMLKSENKWKGRKFYCRHFIFTALIILFNGWNLLAYSKVFCVAFPKAEDHHQGEQPRKEQNLQIHDI